MKLYTAGQMARIDERAILKHNIPSTDLMESAGKGLFHHALSFSPQFVVIFIKGGKNGGDGLVCARHLRLSGIPVTVYAVGGLSHIHPDTAHMLKLFEAAGGKVSELTALDDAVSAAQKADLLIDAIFGTGLNRPVEGLDYTVINWINQSRLPVLCADIPSGLSADTGEVLGTAVQADKTVTFSAKKLGMAYPVGRELSGEVSVCDIGVPSECFSSEPASYETGDDRFIRRILRPRLPNTHKGDYGKILLLCGSTGYTGAACLSAMGAVRAGSGVVYCGVPKSVYPIVASHLLTPVVFPLPDDESGRFSEDAIPQIVEMLDRCDACLIGPGVSLSPSLRPILSAVLSRGACPVVIDADALTILSEHMDLLKSSACPIILTPHAGEFARLTGKPAGSETGYITETAAFSKKYGTTVLHKGYVSAVASPGERIFLNGSGNPGMAKGGSGDVLAGIITAFLGQGIKPYQAAAAAAHIHGLAGDLAAKALGQVGMTPLDLIDQIPFALKTPS